ncbi:MAG: CDP-archaeol synthase [Eubacteriales bacterium]|nr:CDP-archaeol synthase [Eubacteriales bacterium]
MRIAEMYITMLPTILGGISNMLFTKTKWYRQRRRPLDGGRLWSDGQRILGDGKTGIGLVSMVVLTLGWQLIWGLVCYQSGLAADNELYRRLPNTLTVNALSGAGFGLAYMLFELPNSFIKRRLNIAAGADGRKGLKILFFFVDQFDSMIGVIGLLAILAGLSWPRIILYVLVGGLTHVTVNALLIACRVRSYF